MGQGLSKSAVQERVATDDQIFKRLNKRINNLDKPINQTATIQTSPNAIRPDGTEAKTADDIRLAEGKPLRTPRGVLEYKEDKPDDNFPIKVSLETTKYEAVSFYETINTEFESFLQGYNVPPMEPPLITVTSGPTFVQETVEVIDLPSEAAKSENEEEGEEAVDLKTASEEFGDDFELKTEINAAGELTGVAGTIWMIWKGIKYRFYNNPGGNDLVSGTAKHTTVTTRGGAQEPISEGQTNPGPITGLTNSVSGRNLEVFMKQRDLSYQDIEIVPKAELTSFRSINTIVNDAAIWDSIEWQSDSLDGLETNSNTVVIGDFEYEPGDIINPSDETEPNWNARAFLPDMSDEWTEFHPHDLDKPAKRSQVYTPTGNEFMTKQWEGKLLRCWKDENEQGYFMVMEGNMYKAGGGVIREFSLVTKKPFGTNYKGKGQFDKYHDKTYTAMDWSYFKEIGNGTRPQVQTLDGSERVDVYQHGNKGGWKRRLKIGTHAPSGYTVRGSFWSNSRTWTSTKGTSFPNNAISSIMIPKGLSITVYDQPGSPAGGSKGDDWQWGSYSPKTWNGPQTVQLGGTKYNDDISKIKVFSNGEAKGITNGAGWRDRDHIKRYLAGAGKSGYYKKAHLKDYNKLFE